MALNAYLAATNRLLQNPLPTVPLYSTGDLTVYINEGRQQLAAETECVRATAPAALVLNQQIYPFNLLTTFVRPSNATGYIQFASNPSPGDTITLNGVTWTFVSGAPTGNETTIQGTVQFTIVQLQLDLNASANASLTVAIYFGFTAGPVQIQVTYKTPGTAGNAYTLAASAATPSGGTLTGGLTDIVGIQSVLSIKQLAVQTSAYKVITGRPWPWFNRYNIAKGSVITPGVPSEWSQQSPGSYGIFAVSPPPSSAYLIQADVTCLPSVLSSDTDYEAIPYPFTDAVAYYAAYKAYLSSQKTQDATTMFGRYKEYARRATQMTSPDVVPTNFPGGLGSQIVGAKQTLTQPPQQGAA